YYNMKWGTVEWSDPAFHPWASPSLASPREVHSSIEPRPQESFLPRRPSGHADSSQIRSLAESPPPLAADKTGTREKKRQKPQNTTRLLLLKPPQPSNHTIVPFIFSEGRMF
uniref:Uncharacterized protein n=1 Tax=Denticeps clupeoides TaxID=299321 RepID=A0AAY4AHW9_9TELE